MTAEVALREHLPAIEREQVLVVIAGRISDALVSGLLTARTGGYSVLLLATADNPGHDRVFNTLMSAGSRSSARTSTGA